MSTAIPQPFGYQRLNANALDISSVQESMSAFTTYLSGGTAYPGQVVAVKTGGNVLDLYQLNVDLTYKKIGEVSEADVEQLLDDRIGDMSELIDKLTNEGFLEP